MRGKISVLTILGVVLSLCALTASARAEEQQPEIFVIWEIMVKPGKIAQYEKTVKEETAMYTENNWPYPSVAYSTNDHYYYFLTPIKSFADLDTIYMEWAKLLEKLGKEKYEEAWTGMAKNLEYYKLGMIRRMPELSYAPEGKELKPEEANFMYWGLCYVKPGKEQAFEENFKKVVDLYSSKNVTEYGWNTFVLEMGMEMPLYFYAMPGKSAADFWSRVEKGHAKAGEEQLMEIWNKSVLPNVKKYEYKLGMARPDLSYIPKEK